MKVYTGCAFVILALAAPVAADVYAADYPERNITVVVPFPPGGASDVTARLTSNKLSERVGKSVIIENRAGANGGLGAAGVKSAAPDGYTVLIGSIGVYAINPGLYKNLKYDPLKDFDLLSLLVRTPNVLVTSPDFPVNTAADLIAHLKKNPNQVTFASSGIGSSDHLTAALFWQKTGTTGVHVPYKGGGPAINDLMGEPRERFVPKSRRRRSAHQSGQTESLGSHRREARGGPAGCPDNRGSGHCRSCRLFLAGSGGAKRVATGCPHQTRE